MRESKTEKFYQELLDNDLFLQWILHPTDKTNEYWTKMMKENPDKKEAIQNLKTIITNLKVEEDPLSENIKNDLWIKIDSGIHKRQNKKTELKRFLRYAAVAIILLISSFYIYLENTKEKSTGQTTDLSQVIAHNNSGQHISGNAVVLLTHDEKIEIEDEKAELIYDTNGKIIVNSKAQQTTKQPARSAGSYNQLVVPYGKTSNIILSDGTKIWVNSGSCVIYPSVFSGQKREIYVEGEIYLEVAHNSKVPFVVKTDKLEVNVLGTSFNVSAYKNDDNQTIVLATGSVSIHEINKRNITTIRPNQKFTFDNATSKANTENIDVLNYISWKYGFLIFEKENLNNILKKIERYYNIPIICQTQQINHITLSGKLDLKENIEETFRIISITAPIKYQIEKNKIIINVKP